MLTRDIIAKVAAYWRGVGVMCETAVLRGKLAGSDLALLWETVGMPVQTWWLFSFEVPVDPGLGDSDVLIGSIGDWRLYYRLDDNACFEMDLQGRRRFVNTSLAAFALLLALWDWGYRRIQNECPGDGGEDWARGDAIVADMKTAMRAIDPAAFDDASNFWPTLIFEMAE